MTDNTRTVGQEVDYLIDVIRSRESELEYIQSEFASQTTDLHSAKQRLEMVLHKIRQGIG